MAVINPATVIGRSSFVRGRVTGTGDLEISGRIEGDVAVTGEVIVEASGLVAASISGRRIIVRGAVKGDLTAEEAVLLEPGARVVGDLRAPRVAIAPGGLVRGHVQTGAAGAARPRAASATAARTSSNATAATQARSAPKPAPVAAAPARVEPKSVAAAEPGGNGSRPATHRNAGPPPPVVQALKKGTKAVAHHKKR